MAHDQPDGWAQFADRRGRRHQLTLAWSSGTHQIIYSCRCRRWRGPRNAAAHVALVRHEWRTHRTESHL